MAENNIPKLEFTRSWENSGDYPTVLMDEAQIRKDMQSLHDETKEFLNNELGPVLGGHASRHAADGDDPITPEMIGAATADDHKFRSYTALSDIGLSDDNLSDTDTHANLMAIYSAMYGSIKGVSELALTTYSNINANLWNSLVAKLKTDLAITTTSPLMVRMLCYSYILEVEVTRQTYSSGAYHKQFSCVLRYANGATYLSPFCVTRAIEPGDIGAVPTTRKINGKELSEDITLEATDFGAAGSAHASRHATEGDDPVTPAMIGAAVAADHSIKAYTALSQIGLSDSDMSETDALSNFISIFSALDSRSFLSLSVSASTNLSKSIRAKINADLGLDIGSYLDVQCFRSGGNMLQIDVELQYYNASTLYPANRYSCVLRYASGSIEYLSPFVLTRALNGFYGPDNKPTADDVGARASDWLPTAKEIGLGNVPNVATNDQTPTYSAASALTSLTSGEKLSIAFGKIAKAITDLISHLANTSNPHKVTADQTGAVPTTRKVNDKALSKDISLTASDVGARTDDWLPTPAEIAAMPLIVATSSSYDMDEIIKSGVHFAAYRTGSSTLGTPYKYGESSYASALIISIASGTSYGQQLAIVCGGACLFHRRWNGTTLGDWSEIYSEFNKPSLSELGITAGTTDITAGTDTLATGCYYDVYE